MTKIPLRIVKQRKEVKKAYKRTRMASDNFDEIASRLLNSLIYN